MRRRYRTPALLSLLFALGCGANTARPPASPDTPARVTGPLHPVSVSEADYSKTVYRLLLNGEPTQERMDVLAGTVRSQFKRAEDRFAAGHAQAGAAATLGAFYLLRANELHREMLEGSGKALEAAAAESARLGDEGSAFAYYSLLFGQLTPGPEQRDVGEHLGALQDWTQSTRIKGSLQAAGADQRAAISRALIEISGESLNLAERATVSWIEQALDSNVAERAMTDGFSHDEAVEAYRAIRTGWASLIGLHLRSGDAGSALLALDRNDLTRIVPPGVSGRLEHATEDRDPDAWLDLFRFFDTASQSDRPEVSLPPDLARAAAWGSAVELFRAEPSSMRGAAPLATLMLRYGLEEAAPSVLAPALDEDASIDALSLALSIVLRSLLVLDEIDDLPAARRAFEAAKPILELGRGKAARGRTRPTPARLDYVMGVLELRQGELARARPHLERAASEEPSFEVLRVLANINRQRGQAELAVATLEQARQIAEREQTFADAADALLAEFETERDLGRVEPAKRALGDALRRALDARRLATTPPAQAGAERILARILELYGDLPGARRATERAYEASASDSQQLSLTVQDAARRGLTQRDLKLSRDAVARGIEAGLDGEDLVYPALWLQLLEKQLGVPSNGVAEQALAGVEEAAGWVAKLRAWARGRLNDSELMAQARGPSERTEATFYAAMAAHAQGQKAESLPKLREVASSESIELVEVTIARDLVLRHSGSNPTISLPPGIEVP
jgi:cellulose synthase operon protein C